MAARSLSPLADAHNRAGNIAVFLSMNAPLLSLHPWIHLHRPHARCLRLGERAEVQVFDLATGKQVPFLSFGTTGGSNAMPGLLTSTGPASAALSVTTKAHDGRDG
jgi:hypothetical protein